MGWSSATRLEIVVMAFEISKLGRKHEQAIAARRRWPVEATDIVK